MKAVQFVLTVNVPDDTDDNDVIRVVNDMLNSGKTVAKEELDEFFKPPEPNKTAIAADMTWSLTVKD